MVGSSSTLIDSRYAPIACARCRRHAAIYDLRYPHRVLPPSKNQAQHVFDIHDAKRYILLKDKKINGASDIIDLRAHLEEELGSAQRVKTLEAEKDAHAQGSPRKARSNAAKQVAANSKSSPKKLVRKEPLKRQKSTRPLISQPRLSRYEEMQLLIANSENEAINSSGRTLSLRNSLPVNTFKAKTLPRSIKSSNPERSRRSHNQRGVTEPTVSGNSIASMPTSPTKAVYDEFQEILKNAMKAAENGEGRSRRLRAASTDDDSQTAPRKRRKETARQNGSTLSEVMSEDAIVIDKDKTSGDTPEVDHEPMCDISTVEKPAKSIKRLQQVPAVRVRRNVRSLGGNEIIKVESDMATVKARYLNKPSFPSHPHPLPNDTFNDNNPKRSPVLTERNIQPLKTAEAEVLEENRLFMFAILATEGNQRT